MKVEKRLNEVVNRLNKTKTERFPDLRVEREQRDQEEREDRRKEMQEKVKYSNLGQLHSANGHSSSNGLTIVVTEKIADYRNFSTCTFPRYFT